MLIMDYKNVYAETDTEYGRQKAESVGWFMFICGISELTRKTLPELFARGRLFEKISGQPYFKDKIDIGMWLSPDILLPYVNLKINIKQKTWAQFVKAIIAQEKINDLNKADIYLCKNP